MLGIGGAIVWVAVASSARRQAAAVVAPAPALVGQRPFNLFVKSEPAGADIFLNDSRKPIGATPVTLPIDLAGAASVKLVLKKPGFEDYAQSVSTDDPLSISLRPKEKEAPAPREAPPKAKPPLPIAKLEPSRPASPPSSARRPSPPPAPKRRPPPTVRAKRNGELVNPF
jgi:hypothetical protein